MDTLEKIKRKVSVDPETKCWIWHGAFKDARPNLYVVNNRQFSLPPRPWMRDGKSFNHPIRILKRPPKHIRLQRTCNSPFCCNPDHWTFPGEVHVDPRLERARDLYLNCEVPLPDIRSLFGDEIADQLKAEDF